MTHGIGAGRIATALMAVGLMSLGALAQPPGPPGGGPRGFGRGGPEGGMGMLLRMPEVREELGLLGDQEDQLRELGDELRDRFREEMRGMRDQMRDPDAREEVFARLEELRGEAEERLGEVLTTEQLTRLKQINLQQQMQGGGARAILNPQLAEKLGITDEQRDQLREKAQEVQRELNEKIQQLRKEAQDEILEVLTTEQRSQLEQMLGDSFDVPDQRGRRGRNAQRGGRRGGPGGPPPGPELD